MGKEKSAEKKRSSTTPRDEAPPKKQKTSEGIESKPFSALKTKKSSTTKRLKKELAEISLAEGSETISAGPESDNLYSWIATLQGPEGSPYEGGQFFLSIQFPKNYPFAPPKVLFRTKIYHCNIDAQGNICLDILKDKWSPALSIQKVLLSISTLLTDPNPDDPLVSDIAKHLKRDKIGHNEVAKKWTKEHAAPK
eukprot:snap_masked-scaffold_36-processed-gene-1.40-mRNA-1 protein AED:0.35 eAED:0.35 QI:0/-1/0/1/-1/1/1/0/194